MAKILTPIKPLRIISSNGSLAGLGTDFPFKLDITEGVPLQPTGSGDDWDLANPSQWGEACLMLANGTPVE